MTDCIFRERGVAEDAPVPERAGAELHPPLEPADDLLLGEEPGGALDQVRGESFSATAPADAMNAAISVVGVRRPEVRAVHPVALRAMAAVVPEHLVVDRERDADRATGVARRGLDPEALERALSGEDGRCRRS
jgi:hypothetical protein